MDTELKTGEHFSIDEKEVMLYAITKAKDFYSKYGLTDAATRASCPLLNEGIQAYLLKRYVPKEASALREYIYNYKNKQNLRILGEQLFTKLKLHYHNPEFYISKGLNAWTDKLFWWPLHDSDSRIKAMDILEQAIIND